MSGSSSKMSVTQLTLLTALNMMGSGIIMLPTKLAEVGTFSIISWLVTAGGSTALAYAFAKCGMLSRNRGGMGGYAEYAFGKSGSFLANYAYCVSLLIANIAIAISAVGYAVALFGLNTTPFETCLLTIAVLWICTVLNFKGAKITGLISNFTAWGVIIPVAGISVFGWFWFNPDTYTAAWNPHNLPAFDAVSASISMTLWSFLGLESACANSEAVDNPEKNVPKAVLGATLGVAVIYILSTNVAAGIVDNAELVKSTAPFGLVFATMFNGTVGQIVMGLMILSCSGSLLSWQFTIARVFKSSADEGYFPKWFSKVTKDDAPVLGMTIIVSVQTLMSFMTISPSLYRQFNTLVDLAVVTNVMPYLLSMAAVFVMLKAEGVTGSQALVAELIPAKDRARHLSLLMFGWYAGALFAVLISWPLRAFNLPWLSFLWIQALLAIFFWFGRRSVPESAAWSEARCAANSSNRKAAHGIFAEEGTLTAFLFCTVFWLCQTIPATVLMFYSTKILSGFLDTESTFIQVLLLYGCFFIGVLPSTHPALAKRPKAVLIGTFFLMAFALGIIALGQDIHSSVLMGSAFILFALAYGLQTPLDFVFPNMLFPAGSRARLVGLTTTISRIGSMGAAFAFPLLSESFSVESLFWAGCAFLLFGAAFSWKNAPQDAY